MDALQNLAWSRYEQVRVCVAANPNSEAEVLSLLFKDRDPGVRREVARNHNTDYEVLDILSDDDCSAVRGAVAAHPATRPETLRRMGEKIAFALAGAATEHAFVSEVLVQNPNAPSDIKATISKGGSSSETLQEKCARKAAFCAEIAGRGTGKFLSQVEVIECSLAELREAILSGRGIEAVDALRSPLLEVGKLADKALVSVEQEAAPKGQNI